MRATLAGFVAFALAGAVSANAATLVGTNVTLNYIFPSAGTVFGSSVLDVVTDPTVLPCSSGGAGVCSAFVENATFTVGANTLTLAEDAGSSYNSAAFNGVQYANLDFGSGISGFTLSTNLPGLTAANVSFTPDSIEFNAQGLSFGDQSYFVTLTLNSVPEPSTWGMMLLGFAALGFAGYRTSRKGSSASA